MMKKIKAEFKNICLDFISFRNAAKIDMENALHEYETKKHTYDRIQAFVWRHEALNEKHSFEIDNILEKGE